MFKHILVPTDGTARSRRAIRLAVRLAREQNARITGIWVGPAWEPNLYAYDQGVPAGFVSPRRHAAHLKQAAGRRLAVIEKAARAAGVECRCVNAESMFPHAEILNAARRNRCDLIVMASHGRRGVSRLLLGSEAAKVLAHARVPVLICR